MDFLRRSLGGKFDEYNRHIRTRDIGVLIAKIGKRGVFKADGRALETDLLMELVINAVQRKMGAHRASSGLPFAWQGIDGWNPPVAIPLRPSVSGACRWAGSGAMMREPPPRLVKAGP